MFVRNSSSPFLLHMRTRQPKNFNSIPSCNGVSQTPRTAKSKSPPGMAAVPQKATAKASTKGNCNYESSHKGLRQGEADGNC
jgi:hypothetical protein